ncbi:UNKNOWN [Stylonychia lemnae]|uniref:Uncharacterized protein n=1 Tax=Stylonychia lemnae TaxID=5949 RepID=A0A078AFH6_STYLE|nr:UNKNOWN [Stylonychia lemnae]|eukprot:CDW80945.1 UNKNOWN [Stylonychia lemnae]
MDKNLVSNAPMDKQIEPSRRHQDDSIKLFLKNYLKENFSNQDQGESQYRESQDVKLNSANKNAESLSTLSDMLYRTSQIKKAFQSQSRDISRLIQHFQHAQMQQSQNHILPLNNTEISKKRDLKILQKAQQKKSRQQTQIGSISSFQVSNKTDGGIKGDRASTFSCDSSYSTKSNSIKNLEQSTLPKVSFGTMSSAKNLYDISSKELLGEISKDGDSLKQKYSSQKVISLQHTNLARDNENSIENFTLCSLDKTLKEENPKQSRSRPLFQVAVNYSK